MSSIKLKNILILAGGDSTRFWPLTKKSYFSFLGKPLVLHLIDSLKQFAENSTIVINPQDVQLIDQSYRKKIQIISQAKHLKGQAGAILSARQKIKGEVLILNAEDIFNHKILFRYIDILKLKKPDCLLVGKKVTNYFPGGYFKFGSGKLIGIVEKPKKDKVPSDIVRLVVDCFSNFGILCQILDHLKLDSDDWYEQGINKYIKKLHKVDYLLYDDYWFSLKYPWQVLPMMEHFLGRLKEGEVKLGKNVKVAKTAKIVGPTFIGDNTIIGDFVMIRHSHIGRDSLIGGYSEVTRSYLGNNVSLHRNYVGDSVLDDDVSFGAEAATANFRFDEMTVKSAVGEKKIDTYAKKLGAVVGTNSKIGVNATLLPGVKIGRNTFVGPGETIGKDIPDGKFIFNNRQTSNRLTGSR